MQRLSKFLTNIAFLDLIFNLALGAIALVILMLPFLNPPSAEDLTRKAEFVIILQWNDKLSDDLDLWILTPDGRRLSWRNKSTPDGAFLDRDDLGSYNDTVRNEDGSLRTIETNEEVATLRATKAGWYTINVHYYRIDTVSGSPRKNDEIRAEVQLIDLNPVYKVLKKKRLMNLNKHGDEETFIRFRVDEAGEIVEYEETQMKVVK